MNRRLAAVLLILCASVLSAGCFPLVVGGAAGAGALIADRRQPDIVATDQRIEWTMGQEIEKRVGKDKVHINVTSYNRQVLLTGEVTTPEGKAMIDDIASTYQEPAEVVEYYNANRELMAGVESAALEDQVVDYILGQAKVTEQESTYDDMIKAKAQ